MISLIQRVSEARVVVDGAVIGQIGAGLLVLVCAERGDSESQADRLLAKLLKLRIFSDEAGKMNRSVQDVAGGLLIVSQFWRPTPAAAIARASPRLRRRTRGAGSTTTSSPRRGRSIRWSRRGALRPI